MIKYILILTLFFNFLLCYNKQKSENYLLIQSCLLIYMDLDNTFNGISFYGNDFEDNDIARLLLSLKNGRMVLTTFAFYHFFVGYGISKILNIQLIYLGVLSTIEMFCAATWNFPKNNLKLFDDIKCLFYVKYF